jgi:hypothetical protein
MFRKAAPAILAALAAASCMTGGFKPESPDPVVWVDSDKHDWGTIPAVAPVEHVFKVRNTGGAGLNIARVQTSCGCTAAVMDHQFLKPGEETRLKVTFDPRGRSGPQTRTIWIHSNDPKTPQKQIVISSTIEAAAPASPFPNVSASPVPASGTTMAQSAAVSSTAAPLQPASAGSATTAAATPAPAPVATAPAPAPKPAPAPTAPKPK